MVKPRKITYKVFLFERVKKKIFFFDTQTFPLQIRLTAGTRTLYLKSYFFSILQQSKHQQKALFRRSSISIDDVINTEEALLQYILKKETTPASLDTVRQEYNYFAYDILDALDEQFKRFLVTFFYAEDLPAYALFIQHDGSNHTSEFILDNLEKSLQPAVYIKLLQSAIKEAPPYIPFITFFRNNINSPLPVFPVYVWKQEITSSNFSRFIRKKFPEYEMAQPVDYINKLLERH